jgi:hypothetical protein
MACHKCGCRDVRVFAGRVYCRHCGTNWPVASNTLDVIAPPPANTLDAVAFTPMLCPKCQSKEVKTTSTRKPVRMHKCAACGWTFKSVEAI